jgi:hypothetical protein
MWKLIYIPTAKFCVDAGGDDLIFDTEEEALAEVADGDYSHNYRAMQFKTFMTLSEGKTIATLAKDNGYVTTPQLRALLVAQVTNEEALLEVLQVVQWSFHPNTVAGDALTVACMALDAHIEGME